MIALKNIRVFPIRKRRKLSHVVLDIKACHVGYYTAVYFKVTVELVISPVSSFK